MDHAPCNLWDLSSSQSVLWRWVQVVTYTLSLCYYWAVFHDKDVSQLNFPPLLHILIICIHLIQKRFYDHLWLGFVCVCVSRYHLFICSGLNALECSSRSYGDCVARLTRNCQADSQGSCVILHLHQWYTNEYCLRKFRGLSLT